MASNRINPSILSLFAGIEAAIPLNVDDDDAFAVMKKTAEARRFFQYWSKVEKKCFPSQRRRTCLTILHAGKTV